MNIQTLKGFRDFLPKEAVKRQFVSILLKKTLEKYGFEPLETPALEYEEILLGKYGADGDKLMYRFEDNGGRKVALRYDQTVPLARVVAQYPDLPKPFKRYQLQSVFRAENTQKGRYREFLQADADIVGTDSPLSDAEIIALAVNVYKDLGFKNLKVIINDRAVFELLLTREAVTQEKLPFVIRSLDKIKKIGREAVLDELNKGGFETEQASFLLQTVEQIQSTQRLREIFGYLDEFGVSKNSYEFSPTLARGLDYYTGAIFEIESSDYPAGSLCGGGRYDNLIGLFGKESIPAVGFAVGFDRTVEAMETLNLFPKDLKPTKVLVTIFSRALEYKSLEIADELRSNGINTDLWLDTETKLDKQLKYADQKQIPFAVIVGPEEAEKNQITLKDLRGKSQQTISLDTLIQKLSS